MLSITTTMVRVDGRMRAMTSLISSVWMRRPLNALGLLSLTWLLGDRYVGCDVGV